MWHPTTAGRWTWRQWLRMLMCARSIRITSFPTWASLHGAACGSRKAEGAVEQPDEADERPRSGPTGHGGGALRVPALRRASDARSLSGVFDGRGRLTEPAMSDAPLTAA